MGPKGGVGRWVARFYRVPEGCHARPVGQKAQRARPEVPGTRSGTVGGGFRPLSGCSAWFLAHSRGVPPLGAAGAETRPRGVPDAEPGFEKATTGVTHPQSLGPGPQPEPEPGPEPEGCDVLAVVAPQRPPRAPNGGRNYPCGQCVLVRRQGLNPQAPAQNST